MGPKVRMRATSTAPVARVLAKRATATLPPARRSPITPEPITVASSNAVPTASATAPRARLARANERAHEHAIDLRRDRVGVDTGAGQEITGIFHSVDSCRLHVDSLEAGLGKLIAVLLLLERAGHAADPELDALANGRRHLAAHHDVGHGKATAGLEHAKGFGQHTILVGREVDHAIGDDHIHAGLGQGDLLDLALEELRVLDARLALVVAGEGEHLVRHVESVGFAGGPDAPGGEKHVDAAPRAQIQHGLAGLELGERRGIAAAKRGGCGFAGQAPRLRRRVEVGGDGMALAPGRTAAGGIAARSHFERGLAVLVLDDLLDVALAHDRPLMTRNRTGRNSRRSWPAGVPAASWLPEFRPRGRS